MASPDKSVFCIVSKQEVEGKSDREIQAIFRGKHIIIYDQFEPTLSFDEKGLSTLGDLYKSVTIHGASGEFITCHIFADGLDAIYYSKENTYSAESRHQKGTLKDILQCHEEKSKILNALSLLTGFSESPSPNTYVPGRHIHISTGVV
jgi:hypothetical protein